jgi:BirA family biotin operon repressor/biotin-[acetyl-CoA-carboxylase] ligase
MEHIHLDTITSTNDYAKELLEEHKIVAVSANFQTAGRGRHSNTWIGDNMMNIYLSVGIRHDQGINFNRASLTQAIGCLAVCQALKVFATNSNFFIKYPNDIYAQSSDETPKKISGILTEHSFQGSLCSSSVIGIGININQTVFPDDINDKTTSLKIMGYDAEINQIIKKVLENLEELLLKTDKFVFDYWIREMNIINKEISINDEPGLWRTSEVCRDGRLLVNNVDNSTVRYINNGDSIKYDLE